MRFLKKYYYIYLLIPILTYALSYAASESVTTVASILRTPAASPLTIMIDPGHGGEDGGAVSCTGELESHLNLQISLRLNDLLLLSGYRTKMTRSTDVSIYDSSAVTVSEKKVSDLKNRVKLVNSTQNCLLLSIHQNLFEESKYHGAQVFYAPTAGSMELAKSIQASICTGLDPDNHRQTKESLTVYLMKKINCPGVLVECGFLSNPVEEKNLRSDAYQQKLACAITAGLFNYLLTEDLAS